VDVRRFEWRRLGFGIVILLLLLVKLTVSTERLQSRSITRTNLGSKVFQAAPTVVGCLLMTATITLVTVLPADRAESFASFLANKLQR
jgi:uncharacterized membrane protein